jgi:translation elongation factor EF-Tu-like GTPase
MIHTFYDNLEVVDNTPIIVRAELELFSSENGGRKQPFKSGFSPNHNFGDSKNNYFYIGRIYTDNDVFIHPGSKCNVNISFLNVRGLKEKLVIGNAWSIQEGHKIIGICKVIEIISIKC